MDIISCSGGAGRLMHNACRSAGGGDLVDNVSDGIYQGLLERQTPKQRQLTERNK